MSNFGKISVLAFLGFSLFSFGFAATGTSLDGSGDLLKYSDNLEKQLLNLVDSGYDKLYFDFQKTGLNLIKTIDYQSLICLGVLSGDDNILVNIQNEKQDLKKNILKDFADAEVEIMSLEEKNRILKEKGINLFYDNNTYENSKILLKKNIDKLVKVRNEEINAYTKKHTQSVQSFVSDFASYRNKNSELISVLSTKIFGIKGIFDNYSVLNYKISALNSSLLGGTIFANSINTLKEKALESYEKKLTQLVDKSVKRYKKISGLETILEEEKQKAIVQYGLVFDGTLSKVFGNWYRYDRYSILKESLEEVKDIYYAKEKFNCQKILSSDQKLQAKINLLNKDIAAVLSSVENGNKLAQNTGNIKKFKSSVGSAINSFYKIEANNEYKLFSSLVSQKIRELSVAAATIENSVSDVDTGSGSLLIDTGVYVFLNDVDPNFYFKTPFKSNEKNDNVKILQKILTKLSYYSGNISGIYDSNTLSALYNFQKDNGLLKGYENKPSVRGWMGPATRKVLNTYLGK